MNLKLFTSEIADKLVRQNFDRLAEYIRSDPLRKGNFTFREIPFTGTGFPKTVVLAHNLSFIPKDVLQLYVSNAATLVWNYDSFTRTHLSVTVSAACTARFFVGRYEES